MRSPARAALERLAPLACLLASACSEDSTSPGSHPLPSTPDAGTPTGCAPATMPLDDGTCAPAGVRPLDCPPGQLRRDGKCAPAGVPEDGCGEGFSPDGEGGCTTDLPDACDDGTMALPGEIACRPVASCGTGTYGDIDVASVDAFVDASYAGSDSDGSLTKPWTTIQAALDVLPSGGSVAVAAGSYDENVVIGAKPVRLLGRCPSMVEIVGSSTSFPALFIGGAASGTQVDGLAFRGIGFGVYVTNADDVTLSHLWIHDTGGLGLALHSTGPSTSALFQDSLVERATTMGLGLDASKLDVESSVIRSTAPDAQGLFGRGINALTVGTHRSDLTVRGSVLDGNRDTAIFVSGSDGVVESTLIRNTEPDGAGEFGRGIADQTSGANRGNLTLRGSVIQGSFDAAVFVSDSDAHIERTVLEDTSPQASDDQRGVGTNVISYGPERATLTVDASLVRRSHFAGIILWGSIGNVTSTVVRDTDYPATDGGYGNGIAALVLDQTASDLTLEGSLIERSHSSGLLVTGSHANVASTIVRESLTEANGEGGVGVAVFRDKETMLRGSLTLTGSLVETNFLAGIMIAASDATIVDTHVRETSPTLSDQRFGRGIEIQGDADNNAGRSVATVSFCEVERNHNDGIFTHGSDTVIEGTVVRDTLVGTEGWGRGVSVQDGSLFELSATPEDLSASLVIRGSLVEHSSEIGVAVFGAKTTIETSTIRDVQPVIENGPADGLVSSGFPGIEGPVTIEGSSVENCGRAGVASFGSNVTLGSTTLSCNAIMLDGETLGDLSATFVDLGANSCACKGAVESCSVASSSLEPPKPLEE